MKQIIKVIAQDRGRLTIPQPYVLADNIKKGDLLKITIEKVDVNKEE